jgi:hypothetical protein
MFPLVQESTYASHSFLSYSSNDDQASVSRPPFLDRVFVTEISLCLPLCSLQRFMMTGTFAIQRLTGSSPTVKSIQLKRGQERDQNENDNRECRIGRRANEIMNIALSAWVGRDFVNGG